MKTNKNHANNKGRAAEFHPMYHNTEILLKRYRDTIWGLEVAMSQVKNSFRKEFDMSIEDFLDITYCAGIDLSGTEVDAQVKSIEKTRKMITILERAVNMMRDKHKFGEAYYWILYFTYLCPQQLQNTNEVIGN